MILAIAPTGTVHNFRGTMAIPALAIYFIDGYNLLHRESGLASLLATDPAGARTLFCRWLVRQDRLPVEQIRLVLDGARLPDEQPPAGLMVSWAAAPETADGRLLKLISREVRRASQRLDLVLVSDDAELRQQAKFRGVTIMACARFRQDFLSASLPDPADVRGASGDDSQEDRQSRKLGPDADGLRVRKSGSPLSDREVDGWLSAFQAPADSGDQDADASTIQEEGWVLPPASAPRGRKSSAEPDSAPRAEKPARAKRKRLNEDDAPRAAGQAPDKMRRKKPLSPEEAEFARLMGVDRADPNLYEPDDEDPFADS